jgi:CrcB protein
VIDSTPIAISTGAVVGALGRHYTSQFWVAQRGTGFPYGTLFVNLTGACLIGLLATGLEQVLKPPPQFYSALVTGFLGAYTTFSTYILDTETLRHRGSQITTWIYGIGTPLFGFLGVEMGRLLALWWSSV